MNISFEQLWYTRSTPDALRGPSGLREYAKQTKPNQIMEFTDSPPPLYTHRTIHRLSRCEREQGVGSQQCSRCSLSQLSTCHHIMQLRRSETLRLRSARCQGAGTVKVALGALRIMFGSDEASLCSESLYRPRSWYTVRHTSRPTAAAGSEPPTSFTA